MIKQRKIELLAPAKNLECGIEAVNHGADAVYIGAPKFGARAPLWWSMPICIMSVSM
jgi:collagenase-like PrtC family protease